MKFKSLFVALCGMFMFTAAASSNDAIKVTYNDVPAAAKQFVAKYFNNQEIQSVTKDAEDAIPDYDIYLKNGTKIEVNINGDWTEISNTNGNVPLTVLPDSAVNYMNANYAKAKVVKIEKDGKGYEVKLSNGTEVEFDANGGFLKIDR